MSYWKTAAGADKPGFKGVADFKVTFLPCLKHALHIK